VTECRSLARISRLFSPFSAHIGCGAVLIDRLITWFWPYGREWLDAHSAASTYILANFLT
jgi:hypothetical protein